MIRLENISKVFDQKKKQVIALNNVSLQIPKGQIVGVIGESGAGKSTLIRIVNLLEKPTSGKVYINNVNLLDLSEKELRLERKKIGMIFQHFNLLSSRTVFENIALPLELEKKNKIEIETRVKELLELVGIQDKSDEYPSKLSGGQKQRVAIARTLATNPSILLCDEATSALDPTTTKSILDLLKSINKKTNITILLITHEMDVIKEICDEVTVISQGKLIEKGSVSEIFSNPREELTKQFILASLQINVPEEYKLKINKTYSDGKHHLLWIEFSGNKVEAPILSEIARRFNIDYNIINAKMDYIGSTKFGIMLVELLSSHKDELDAIKYLQNNNIKVKIIGYV